MGYHFNKLKKDDPAKMFIDVENKEGATLNRGEIVEWDLTNTVGFSVEEVDSATPAHVAGVVEDTTIADGAVGRIQISGLHDAVLTSTTVTAGLAVAADTESGVGKAVDHSASTDLEAYQAAAIIGVALVVNDTNSAKIYLRLM